MFGNYLKVAWRNIRKHKGYSLINVAGLGLGIACCLLIALWIRDELGFDRFHRGADRLHQILVQTDVPNVTTTPVLLAPTIQEAVPEIAETARFDNMGSVLLSRGSASSYENRLWAADPSFFTMFSFPFLQGNAATALQNPGSIVISEAMAEKYFPDEDALGKVLTLNRRDDLTVTGVIRIPRNSTLDPQIVVPMRFNISRRGPSYLNKNNYFPITFVELRQGVSPAEVGRKISKIFRGFHSEEAQNSLTLLPLAARHFSFYADRSLLVIFSVIAFFILALACFNYMNLATARSAGRGKEIGLRKTAGARRGQIVAQFLGESLLLSFAALGFAAALIVLLLPPLNAVSGKSLTLDASALRLMVPAMIGLAVFTGLAGGLYPAVFLSSFSPAKALKGRLRQGASGAVLRKALVIVQFTISIILMAGTGIVYRQLNYIRNKDLGYDANLLVQVKWRDGTGPYRNVFKNALRRDPRILGVTGTQATFPFFGWENTSVDWDGKDPNRPVSLNYNVVDFDFIETMRIEMAEGRSFSEEFSSDIKSGYLINQRMAEFMGGGPAIGKRMSVEGFQGQIIGVARDFNFLPLQERIKPLVLRVGPDRVKNTLIRIPNGNIPASLRFIRETWEKTVPGFPFEYGFLDDHLEMGYQAVEQTGRLVKSFAVLAVLISCLGLIGLSSFLAELRTREIGIRKVLGAQDSSIVWLLSREFVWNVLAANLLAWPIAYVFMNQWIRAFAYRTKMGFGVFVLSGAIALGVALLASGHQSLRAAAFHPAKSLKHE